MLPIVLIVVLGLVQMLFVGYTWMQTSQAARAGARAWAVDDDKDWWTGAAKDQLPKSWRDDAKVSSSRTAASASPSTCPPCSRCRTACATG